MRFMSVIITALTTEKAVAAIEKENKLVFLVDGAATKKQVKDEVESEYGERVRKVTTMVTPDGRKKAFVSFKREGAAPDLAAKLKVI